MNYPWEELKEEDKHKLAHRLSTGFYKKYEKTTRENMEEYFEIKNYFNARLNTKRFDNADDKILYAYMETSRRYSIDPNIETAIEGLANG